MAEIWETVADTIPDAPALVNGEKRRSWRQYDDRAARIASALAAAGLGLDAKVGIYGYNSNEYLEAHFAVFKVRGGPVNVNYRYTEGELIYLLDDADARALVFDAGFAARVAAIRGSLPKLETLIEIDDGSGEHLEGALRLEDLIAEHTPHPRQSYSEDDIYMLYTGGTTGMPKGVMYRQGDFSQLTMGGYDRRGVPRPASREEMAAATVRFQESGQAPISLAAAPLMHGVGIWGGVVIPHNLGGCAVTFRNEHFDSHNLWKIVERERVTDIALVGDAFAKPMLTTLQAAKAAGRPYDLSSLRQIYSSGVMFSREVKEALLGFADIVIVDIIGSTEGGVGSSVVSRALPGGETAQFAINPAARVFNDEDKEVAPGSDEIGMVANGGFSPVGYYKDPAKSARTFRVIDGHRYSFPGDFAKVAADGTLILLGRGSGCINSGGEKIFPEEVEEALKAHPDVLDCLVVGVADERFGERVTAVLSCEGGRAIDEAALIAFARTRIAGYKTPRRVVLVDHVRRAANGKADYRWAKSVAVEASTQ
ncbi:MAG TPA: acyl-CoA synthetase [Caulobacteraceae bacterium]